MFLFIAVSASLAISVLAQQHGQPVEKQQSSLHQVKDITAAEPSAAESSSYGQYGGKYRSANYGGGGSYGGAVDPRYYDRGDTPHFGLAGFPFGYERRYYGQNVVYDNSLAGFPLNYFNYQQDYNNNYNSHSKPSYSKPQYRSAAYTSPMKTSAYPPVEYGAYLNNNKPASYYSLQYGY